MSCPKCGKEMDLYGTSDNESVWLCIEHSPVYGINYEITTFRHQCAMHFTTFRHH